MLLPCCRPWCILLRLLPQHPSPVGARFIVRTHVICPWYPLRIPNPAMLVGFMAHFLLLATQQHRCPSLLTANRENRKNKYRTIVDRNLSHKPRSPPPSQYPRPATPMSALASAIRRSPRQEPISAYHRSGRDGGPRRITGCCCHGHLRAVAAGLVGYIAAVMGIGRHRLDLPFVRNSHLRAPNLHFLIVNRHPAKGWHRPDQILEAICLSVPLVRVAHTHAARA